MSLQTLTVTLTAEPSPEGVPAGVRMRKALKCLRRVFHLRASWPTNEVAMATSCRDAGGAPEPKGDISMMVSTQQPKPPAAVPAES